MFNHTRAILETTPVRGPRRLILLVLADAANEDGVCWPSIATIARRAGLDVRNTKRYLHDLARLGEITIDATAGPRGSHRYALRLGGNSTTPAARPPAPARVKITTPPVVELPPEPVVELPPKLTCKKQELTHTTCAGSADAAARAPGATPSTPGRPDSTPDAIRDSGNESIPPAATAHPPRLHQQPATPETPHNPTPAMPPAQNEPQEPVQRVRQQAMFGQPEHAGTKHASTRHPAVAAYVQARQAHTGKRATPQPGVRDVIAQAVGDDPAHVATWQQAVQRWLLSGYNPENADGMLHWWESGAWQQQGPRSAPPPPPSQSDVLQQRFDLALNSAPLRTSDKRAWRAKYQAAPDDAARRAVLAEVQKRFPLRAPPPPPLLAEAQGVAA